VDATVIRFNTSKEKMTREDECCRFLRELLEREPAFSEITVD
jgi:hypothetical protein